MTTNTVKHMPADTREWQDKQPTEKHRKAAAEVVREMMAGDNPQKPMAPFIAAALAKSERECMKRAAEICEHFAQQWDTGGFDGKPNNGFNACMQARDAILSEAGERA